MHYNNIIFKRAITALFQPIRLISEKQLEYKIISFIFIFVLNNIIIEY